jgi:hypothetical protein
MIDWNIWEDFNWNDNKSVLKKKTSKTGFIEFIGLDKDDIGKGRRRDLIYINEVNKVTHNKYFDISQRAKKVIVDFNADTKFYIHDQVNDINFIKLDFTGNEKLSIEEVRNILSYKKNGYKLDENGDYILDQAGNRIIINEFYANKWRVYGEGEIGSTEGRIYYWKPINYNDYLKIDVPVMYGVDWGQVDPFAIVEAKYFDGNLYVHEINYKSENQIKQGLSGTELMQINSAKEEGLVTWLFNKLGIRKDRVVVCDNNRPTKISSIFKAGWDYAVPVGNKVKLLDRIGNLNSLNIYYTHTSTNIEFEQMNYTYAKDKFGNSTEIPIDMNNHTIDAISYIVQEYYRLGVIKII